MLHNLVEGDFLAGRFVIEGGQDPEQPRNCMVDSGAYLVPLFIHCAEKGNL